VSEPGEPRDEASRASDERASSEHLDLDALADVLADGSEPAHLATCEHCRARLAELEAALPRVSAALGTVADPEPPAGLDARLTAAVAAERSPAQADVLPLVRRRTRWLPALGAVAAAAVLVIGGVLVSQHGGGTTATSADRGPTYAVNQTGTDYTRSGNQLQAALPELLKGSARRAAGAALPNVPAPSPVSAGTESAQKDSAFAPLAEDLLAPLRTTQGLATCLASLTDPNDTGLPLALDYASFEGKPALVVVLPTSRPDKVDVFVVPPGCASADGNVLYFRRLPKP
jgi:hypothetical protein